MLRSFSKLRVLEYGLGDREHFVVTSSGEAFGGLSEIIDGENYIIKSTSFTIDGNNYQVPDRMTWEAWIESECNIDNRFGFDGTGVYDTESFLYVSDSSYNLVNGEDVIIEDENYILIEE